MQLAIISDIHANLPALEAVLADIDRRQPDAIYCLGDLVGYAPWPNEVVRLMRSRAIPTIGGNYDVGVGNTSDDCGCAYQTEEDKARGVESIAYTNQMIGDDERAYLRRLPRHLRILTDGGTILMVHGSPRRVNEYLFADRSDASLLRVMAAAEADIMLFGHTHKPYHKILAYDHEGTTRYRHAINTGSVGKPKDGDPRAGYVWLTVGQEDLGVTAEEVVVDFIRVAYDVERAAQAVEASPLPSAFADMLRGAY